MRILHVVPTYLPAVRYGGTIASVHALCRALRAGGHDVDVATTSVDGRGDAPVPTGVPVALDGVAVRYFRSPAARRLYWSPGMRRALPALVAGADVVHVHSLYLWPTTAAAREARRQRVPYVVSPRGMLERALVRRRSRVAKTLWLALVERGNLERAAAVHFTSERERREARRFGFSFCGDVVIPNGVDLPAPEVAAPGPPSAAVAAALADPTPYVLFLGRISWKKGLDRLVPAMARVAGARLVVAGNDDEGHWPSIASIVRAHRLDGRVSRVGLVGGEDKRRLLAGAAALAVPSYSENFGNVVLEAMAAGRPVVATPEVGAVEIVEREGAGVVVDGEPAALGAALAALIGDAAARERMGARGRAAAAALSWTHVASRMAAAYARILEGAGRG